jgi:hypothetical protein
MDDMEIEMRLRAIEERLARHGDIKNMRIEQIQQQTKSHTDHVFSKLVSVKEQSNTMGEFFQRQKEYYDKIEKSQKKKAKEDKEKLEYLKEVNDKRTESVTLNLKDIKQKQREMFRYYDTRLRERSDKVQEVRSVLREDIDTRKELYLLRKADQEENFMRGQNIHNIYKQKLVEKLIEKRERADKIKEQQQRISDLCRTVRHQPAASMSLPAGIASPGSPGRGGKLGGTSNVRGSSLI